MTQKEKARELVIQMYQPLPASKEAEKGEEHLYYNQYNAAKQCALIAVDEIIWLLNNNQIDIDYWQQVKKEINGI